MSLLRWCAVAHCAQPFLIKIRHVFVTITRACVHVSHEGLIPCMSSLSLRVANRLLATVLFPIKLNSGRIARAGSRSFLHRARSCALRNVMHKYCSIDLSMPIDDGDHMDRTRRRDTRQRNGKAWQWNTA